MKDQLSDKQNEEILKALDEAINKGPWDKSNFLKVIGKNLNDLREKFANIVGSNKHLKAESHLANRIALRSGQQEVFIGIYTSDGSNIQAWERILMNLPRQVISRPIYADEADVKELIKTKENKQNEAYVAVYINQSDILPLPPDKVASDKLGKKLLTLKDKSLNLDNISRFVHTSGIYRFERNRLVKNS